MTIKNTGWIIIVCALVGLGVAATLFTRMGGEDKQVEQFKATHDFVIEEIVGVTCGNNAENVQKALDSYAEQLAHQGLMIDFEVNTLRIGSDQDHMHPYVHSVVANRYASILDRDRYWPIGKIEIIFHDDKRPEQILINVGPVGPQRSFTAPPPYCTLRTERPEGV